MRRGEDEYPEGSLCLNHLRKAVLRGSLLPGVVLSLLAIGVRILVATRREGIEVDGITYLQNAQALLTDWRSVNTLQPPLYSLLLAPFLGLWTDPEWGARVISAVLGGLWVWPTLWLASETTDEDVSWTAGLLVALTPAAIEASTRVLSEATFGLCLTGFLVCLVQTLKTASWGKAVLAGVLGGLITQARPEGMGYLILAWSLLALAGALFGEMWTRRVILGRLAVLTLCWLAVISPYAVLIRHQLGYWHWSGKAGISLLFAESVGDEGAGSFAEHNYVEAQQAPTSVIKYLAVRPASTLRRVAVNLHLVDKYVVSGLLASGGFALVILGLATMRFRRAPAPPEWFLALAPLPLAGLLLYLVSARYFVAMIPVLSIVGGIGLARIGRQDNFPIIHRLSGRSVVLLVVVLLSFVPWIVRPWYRQDPRAVEKAAGVWLKQTVGPGIHFVGPYPVIAYYAESEALSFGKLPVREVVARGRHAGARFLVADNFRLPEFPPDLAALTVADPGVPPILELARIFEDRAGRRIFIYRIL